MQDYLNSGHMELIPPAEIEVDDENCFYLPHHAVIKESSTTTQQRTVFDGSSESSNGVSLNDTLLVGPTIQRDIWSILIHFRFHKYVLTADIEKMYRQIRVSSKDIDLQRILWRPCSSLPLQHFRLLTVTYGTSSAPYLATQTLHQLAEDHRFEYPLASSVVTRDFYVDDLMTGSNSLSEALEIQRQLKRLMTRGGFHLRKWSSNHKSILMNVANDQQPVNIASDSDVIKVLGIYWSPVQDCFRFTISMPPTAPATKRKILSDIGRIFDPLGWLAPSTISLKILLQRLWLHNLSWDDILPTHLVETWTTLRDQLIEFEKIEIPRWLKTHSKELQFHGFSDASEDAYAAVIYCRCITEDNQVSVTLVAAKTRVAPLKQISTARLELCGALLLAQLVNNVKRACVMENPTIFCYTDSSIVLAWLSDHPKRWVTFVANRTSEILEIVPRKHWYHVPGEQNPADCASRGLTPIKLINHRLWWTGPYWLKEESSKWPQSSGNYPLTLKISANTNMEERKSLQIYTLQSCEDGHFLDQLSVKLSSWSKIIRVIVYISRFANKLRKRSRNTSSFITTEEIHNAKLICYKWMQEKHFFAELKILRSNKPLSGCSSLMSLSPFLDGREILRVGGRIQNSMLSFQTKHPIIIPKNNPLTVLIIKELHTQHQHAGPTLLNAIVGLTFWIPGLRTLSRKLVHNCIVCFRHKQQNSIQLMGNLPAPRVQPSRPFTHTGCDYAGPINILNRKGRGSKTIKAYIALFICMSTKAIHLELVSDLTTEAFIAALYRFFARRGLCSDLYSDNGTNFVGANRKFNEMYKIINSTDHNTSVSGRLAVNNIRWHFNPPSAPHFGGLYEAGVKSVKYHLRRVIGETHLVFEEMSTLLCQIEALLNSRPLCSMPDTDFGVLTPAHFLIGEPLLANPEPDLSQISANRLSRWQLLQRLHQSFWKAWHSDYLTSLQQRPKWRQIKDNFEKGDLVLIKEEHTPPSRWALGRIIDCHPGRDKLVRAVTLKTKSGVMQRPIVKICKLPIN